VRAAGGQILFYPTAIGWHPREKRRLGARQHDSWEIIQRSHAVANGCYVWRFKPDWPPNGRPAVRASSFGDRASWRARAAKLLAKAGVDEETVLLATVDLAEIDSTRTHWPFLRGPPDRCVRRPDPTIQRLRHGPNAADFTDKPRAERRTRSATCGTASVPTASAPKNRSTPRGKPDSIRVLRTRLL